MGRPLTTLVLAAFSLTAGAAAGQETYAVSDDATLEECLRAAERLSEELGLEPTVVVELASLHIVRFCTTDESILVSCYAKDRRMVTSWGPREPGCARA